MSTNLAKFSLDKPATNIYAKIGMLKNFIKMSIIFMAVLIFAGSTTISANPATDCVVSGSLKINGQEAPVGSKVEAWIDGRQIVSGNTSLSGQYTLTIPQYDPLRPDQPGYASENDIVLIKVDGREAEPTFNPAAGTLKIDLEIKTTLNVKLTTWGKIKALFK